jgi:hypothetical protein
MRNNLTGQVAGNVNTEPPLLNNLREAYLQADRLCASQVRTEAEYNRISESLALRASVPWQPLDLGVQEAVRLTAENSLRPQAHSIAGLSALHPLLTELQLIPVPAAAGESEASRLHTATEELRRAIKHAATLIPVEAVPDASREIGQFADEVVARFLCASEQINKWLAAKDVLRECRRSGLAYIGNQTALGCPTENCPVCDAHVDSVNLAGSLGMQVAGEDAEGQRLRSELDEIDRARASLESKLSAFNTANVQARQEHDRVLDAIRRIAPRLRSAIGWHPAVVGSADALLNASELWMQGHSVSPSIEAVGAARALSALAHQQSEELRSMELDLNTNLEADHREFRALQALGVVLSIRHALDALSWEASLDQIDADRRRAVQRDRWIAVLDTMAREREARALSAARHVVDDPGVQERFRRLIERLPNHRRLNALQFRGDKVELGQQNAGDTLSEGQNVLVNIAAAMAVVGKVAGTPDHRPGWIVFDEPTNGLDAESCAQVAQYLGGLTTADVPSQIVVATFDPVFAEQLMNCSVAQAQRRVKHVSLPEFQPGRAVTPVIRERNPNPNP